MVVMVEPVSRSVLGGGGVVRKECGALTPRCGQYHISEERGKMRKSRNKPRGRPSVGA